MTMSTETLRYSQSHEWVKVDGETADIGVSGYAQNELGDVVYVELPEVGKALEAGQEAAVLESTKAAADVYSPVSGEVVAVNETLINQPEVVNETAEGENWIFRVKLSNLSELEQLMDSAAYSEMTK